MDFSELNVLVKYCSNRVNGERFVHFMMPRYNDESYIMNLWPQFRDNACMFIVSRNETELFDAIMKDIKDADYKG